MDILDAQETAARLPYADLAESIREVALERGSDTLQAPPRTSLPLPEDAVLLVMPASGGDIAMTKLVTVHPKNASAGLPTIQGEVVVMEAATGERLGVLDGSVVTARRTAALSLLAARELAARPNGPLLIVGAGSQGSANQKMTCPRSSSTQVAREKKRWKTEIWRPPTAPAATTIAVTVRRPRHCTQPLISVTKVR